MLRLYGVVIRHVDKIHGVGSVAGLKLGDGLLLLLLLRRWGRRERRRRSRGLGLWLGNRQTRWGRCNWRLFRVNGHIVGRVTGIIVFVVVVARRISIWGRSLLSGNFVRGKETATRAPRTTHRMFVA
jgi:hypothetical protein